MAGATPLLRPLIGLAGWTFVMEIWMYATRIPAISKYHVEPSPYQTRAQLNEKIPRPVQWVAENYDHLHEQPTVFYAVTLALAVLGDDHPLTVRAAWGYVGLRIVHSLVQATVNKIRLRFAIFAASSVVLAGLTVEAATLVF